MGDIIPVDGGSKDERRTQIATLEQGMRALPQVECPLIHHHANGIYGREIHIPAGTVLVGEIHRFDCLAVLSSGIIRVVTDTEDKTIHAPKTFNIPAGAKNVGFAITDVVWTTFHPNTSGEQDPDALRAMLTTDSYDNVELLVEQATNRIEVKP
jgi:hypothetical protein